MSDLQPDLLTPLKLAVLARLQGHVGAPVFDHVPDGKGPPVVIIDSFAVDAGGEKGGTLDLVTISIQIVAQGRSRDAHRAIMAAVLGRLKHWSPDDTAEAIFGDIMFLSSGEQTLGDGLTHLGDVQQQIFVQPA